MTIEENLEKSCPRCGKASANSSNPQGRCSACLKKLAANKKNPNRYEYHHKVADEALRRQDGRTKQTTKKSKGRGSRAEIIAKLKAAHKATGAKGQLSPDRKDNSKGYASENVRMVPQKLNRGRHNVDPKKLAAWKEKVNKTGIDEVDLLKSLKNFLNQDLIKSEESIDTILRLIESFLI